MSHTRGTITFEGGHSRPPRGNIGIVPQKNVLFPELQCIQTLRVWQAAKWTDSSAAAEDLEALLRDCDSGKRYMRMLLRFREGRRGSCSWLLGFLGDLRVGFSCFQCGMWVLTFLWGCVVVLVDECTSGVDPLSRRALWRTLMSFREDRTIIFTTHVCGSFSFSHRGLTTLVIQFLDEADPTSCYLGCPREARCLRLARFLETRFRRRVLRPSLVCSLRRWRKSYIRVKRSAAP